MAQFKILSTCMWNKNELYQMRVLEGMLIPGSVYICFGVVKSPFGSGKLNENYRGSEPSCMPAAKSDYLCLPNKNSQNRHLIV